MRVCGGMGGRGAGVHRGGAGAGVGVRGGGVFSLPLLRAAAPG